MTAEEALEILDGVLQPDPLSDLQELVFRHAWSGQTYQEIANAIGYDADYTREVGSQLWQTLSKVFGEKVTKNNFRSALRRRSLISSPIITRGVSPEPQSNRPQSGSGDDSLPIPEFPDGPVPLASPFYVERPPLEERAYEEIVKPGALIRIKAPSKWGKTSLMSRILAYADAQAYRNVRVNLQHADASHLTSLDRFIRWFCANLTQQLGLEPKIDHFWDEDLGSKLSCTAYLQAYLLAQLDNPLVVTLDELQRIFEYPNIAKEFLPLLRVWHEEAKNLTIWKKLRLVVVHSTEIYIPLNFNQSPFNVGVPLQLPGFTIEQNQELALLHGLTWAEGEIGAKSLASLHRMLDGHPYLLRLAFYHLSREEVGIETLLKEAPSATGIYSNHLRGRLAMLKAHPNLASVFKKAVESDSPAPSEPISAYQLESMGLAILKDEEIIPRCDLYRQYFRAQLDQL